MKVTVRRGRVVDMRRRCRRMDADGENVGIVKFGADGARLLGACSTSGSAAGGLRDWAPRAFDDFARIRPLHAVGTRGYPWTEIDFPEDYERAVRDILPAIEGDGHHRLRQRRRTANTTVIEQGDDTIIVRRVRLRPGSDTMPLSPASGE